MQATGCDGRPIFSGGLNDEDSVDVTLPHRLDSSTFTTRHRSRSAS